jgi:hypothetical protein
LVTRTVSLSAGKPSVGEVSDSGALKGPNANPAKISPIRSVTQDVLRPVINEVIAFKVNPFCWGLVHCPTRETEKPRYRYLGFLVAIAVCSVGNLAQLRHVLQPWLAFQPVTEQLQLQSRR